MSRGHRGDPLGVNENFLHGIACQIWGREGGFEDQGLFIPRKLQGYGNLQWMKVIYPP